MPRRIQPSEETKDRIVALYESGYGLHTITQRVGLGTIICRRVLHEMGVRKRSYREAAAKE